MGVLLGQQSAFRNPILPPNVKDKPELFISSMLGFGLY